jgi:hypothetical protein
MLILTEAKPIYHDVGSYELTDFWVFNKCTGDSIMVSGTVHMYQLNSDIT